MTSNLNLHTKFSHVSEIFFSGGILSRQSRNAQLFSNSFSWSSHICSSTGTSDLHSSCFEIGFVRTSVDWAEYFMIVTRIKQERYGNIVWNIDHTWKVMSSHVCIWNFLYLNSETTEQNIQTKTSSFSGLDWLSDNYWQSVAASIHNFLWSSFTYNWADTRLRNRRFGGDRFILCLYMADFNEVSKWSLDTGNFFRIENEWGRFKYLQTTATTSGGCTYNWSWQWGKFVDYDNHCVRDTW